MKTFLEMGLPEALIHTLEHMKFNEPTPIQIEAIPLALKGKDILGSAQTGTGKTGAFGIPLVAKLLSSPQGSALVMTPTRELATQVLDQLKLMLGRKSKIKTALLIGGESMPKQLTQLRNSPRIIVGTPGRINDHLKRNSLKLSDTDFLVLDETDRMLDMGFTIQIEKVLSYMPAQRQTLLFSATIPKNIVKITQKYLNNPTHISLSPDFAPSKNIKQDILRLTEADKYPSLLSELDEREGSIIIFVKTKHKTQKMAIKLAKQGYSADAIHGDLRQNKRNRVITAFRKKKYRILVATDVAARGLDIPHISHVINYDLPQCPEDYIHRIGRTARAGAKGCALNLVTPADKSKWNAIDRLLNPDAYPSKQRSNKEDGKRGKRPRFKTRGREDRSEGRPQRSSEGRPQRRSEGRPERRSEGRTERRSEARPQRHTEGRTERRSEGRPQRHTEGRTERRSEGRPQRHTEGRTERRSEARPERRSEGHTERRSEARPQRRKDTKRRTIRKAA